MIVLPCSEARPPCCPGVIALPCWCQDAPETTPERTLHVYRHSVAVDASGSAFAWGWAAAGQLGRWEERSQRLCASIEDQGIRTDSGLHGVLLSEQEGHRALHERDSKLSWTAVALQPRHQALSTAVEVASLEAASDVNTTVADCGGGDAGACRASHGQPSDCQRCDAGQGHEPGSVDMPGACPESPGTRRSWRDPVHGLCVAMPTRLVLTCPKGRSDMVMSCHAEWWHTLLFLAPHNLQR